MKVDDSQVIEVDELEVKENSHQDKQVDEEIEETFDMSKDEDLTIEKMVNTAYKNKELAPKMIRGRDGQFFEFVHVEKKKLKSNFSSSKF